MTSQAYKFEYVDDGVYEGKTLNQSEARRVADSVVSFAKQQLERRERGQEMQSLAVGTFNLRQQLAIQDELEVRRRADLRIEPFSAATCQNLFSLGTLKIFKVTSEM